MASVTKALSHFDNITGLVIFVAFLIAFVVSVFLTPITMRIAHLIGAIDIPKDDRRMHKRAIPRFGGLAIYCGTMVPIILFLHGSSRMMTAALGGTFVYILGALDDKFGLNAKVKLIVEILIALLMYKMGLRILFITNLFGAGHWKFGTALCCIVTVLWLVGVTNTINLIDGLDGLAAGVAAIAATSIAYVAYIHGEMYGMLIVCAAMMALAGASLGFLPYNFYPAKTFMGDGGSLFLGFMLASLSVVGPLKRSTFIAVIVPVFVLGMPLLDTGMAILRRLVNGRPIMSPDKEHLHHQLMANGYGMTRSVLMLYGISATMGMAAILISRELYKDAAVLAMIALLYIYVLVTDPNHKLPRIKAVNIKDDEDRAEAEARKGKGNNGL